MTDAPLLAGLRIQLERTKDVPCGVCGQTVVVVGKAAGAACRKPALRKLRPPSRMAAENDRRFSGGNDQPVWSANRSHHDPQSGIRASECDRALGARAVATSAP